MKLRLQKVYDEQGRDIDIDGARVASYVIRLVSRSCVVAAVTCWTRLMYRVQRSKLMTAAYPHSQ